MGRYSRNSDTGAFFKVGFALVLFVVVITISLRGCTDPAGATRVLTQQGYTNIEITGYRWGMGGEGDTHITGFEATSPNGTRVSGAVTSGWLKGSTIRFD